jgi:glycosyltransferase involved in cell wall biosynthesis
LNPVELLEAVRDLLDAGALAPGELMLRFVGNHGDGNRRLVAALGLESEVGFVGTVDAAAAVEEMRAADALLLLSSGAAHVVPAKTYEYLATGKPLLVVAPEGDLEHLLSASGAIWFGARPDDPVSIRWALTDLLAFLRARCPLRGARREWLAHYERRRLTGRLANVFDAAAGLEPGRDAVASRDARAGHQDRVGIGLRRERVV